MNVQGTLLVDELNDAEKKRGPWTFGFRHRKRAKVVCEFSDIAVLDIFARLGGVSARLVVSCCQD